MESWEQNKGIALWLFRLNSLMLWFMVFLLKQIAHVLCFA